jgi:hypothetical protein
MRTDISQLLCNDWKVKQALFFEGETAPRSERDVVMSHLQGLINGETYPR